MDSLVLKNYKKFRKITIPLPKSDLVIHGNPMSGKTQILWAYLLFCRSGFSKNRNNTAISIYDEARILFMIDSNTSACNFLDGFARIRSDDGFHGTFEILASISGVEFSILFKNTGSLTSTYDESRGNILFAYMSPSYLFNERCGVADWIMTSYDQILRAKLHRLSEQSFLDIKNFVRDLFPKIIDINKGSRTEILIVESDCYYYDEDDIDLINYGSLANRGKYYPKAETGTHVSYELIFASQCLQKVIASLILFFTLFEKNLSIKIWNKYYLIDEPDLHLGIYARDFISGLIRLSRERGIKLIATTSNQEFVGLFSESYGLDG